MNSTEYTAHELALLVEYSALRSQQERVAFAVRRDLTARVLLTVLEAERSAEFRQQIAAAHSNSVDVVQWALAHGDREMIRAVLSAEEQGHATMGDEVKQMLFDFVSIRSTTGAVLTAGNLGLHDFKRAIVESQKYDASFIAQAADHGCEIVRSAAVKYVDHDKALAILRDTRSQFWQQRQVVIDRFPDDAEVADIVVGSQRRSMIANSDRFLSETGQLAMKTTRRETAVALRYVSALTGISPAGVIATRWADDAEMADWFIENGSSWGPLARSTTRPDVIQRLRDYVVNNPKPFTGSMSLQMADAARALAPRIHDDVQFARVLSSSYPAHVVQAMVVATSSRDVLKELARARAVGQDHHLRYRITAHAQADNEVRAIVEETCMSLREAFGRTTPRSVGRTEDPKAVVKALHDDDPSVREAAKAQLRALSEAARATSSADDAGRPMAPLTL